MVILKCILAALCQLTRRCYTAANYACEFTMRILAFKVIVFFIEQLSYWQMVSLLLAVYSSRVRTISIPWEIVVKASLATQHCPSAWAWF